MPGTKEIRMKIRSVQNTRKITKAMEMVAASKMKKSQDRMRATRPSMKKHSDQDGNIERNHETNHPFQQTCLRLDLENLPLDAIEPLVVIGESLGSLSRLVLRSAGGKERVIDLRNHR